MDPFQNPGKTPDMQGMPGMQNDLNLWGIIVNVAFGFVAGLMIFLGPAKVIAYATKLAKNILASQTGPIGAYGFASAAPYVVLAPLAALVVKQLSSVRSLKSFIFFAAAVIVGIIIAFFAKGSLGI